MNTGENSENGEVKSDKTLQFSTALDRAGRPGRVSQRMNAFLREYENTCGNISASCLTASVSRMTYYRWVTGTSKMHLRFQRRLLRIKPEERLLDIAENVVLKKLAANDLDAAKFVLDRKGKLRGYGQEKSDKSQKELGVSPELITQVANAYVTWIDLHPDATLEQKIQWLGKFAERSAVPPAELQAAVKGIKSSL